MSPTDDSCRQSLIGCFPLNVMIALIGLALMLGRDEGRGRPRLGGRKRRRRNSHSGECFHLPPGRFRDAPIPSRSIIRRRKAYDGGSNQADCESVVYGAIRTNTIFRLPTHDPSSANTAKRKVRFAVELARVQLTVIRSSTWVTPGADQAVFSARVRW